MQYKTKDIHLSAFLLANRVKLLSLEKESDYFLFVFDDNDKCSKLSDSYYNSEGLVNGKVFAESLKTLKDRLFAYRNLS